MKKKSEIQKELAKWEKIYELSKETKDPELLEHIGRRIDMLRWVLK